MLKSLFYHSPKWAGVILFFFILFFLPAQEAQQVPARSEIPVQYTWDLTDLFPNDAAWEQAFNEVEAMIPQLASFEGQLGNSAEDLLACLQLKDAAGQKLDRLYSYAQRKLDQDQSNSTYQALSQRIRSLGTRMARSTAYIKPEILTIDNATLTSFLNGNSDLQLYQHYLDNITRLKPHILSKEEEEILALSREATYGSSRVFSLLTNTDFTWGTIYDADSNAVEMSRSRYYLYMTNPDRRVRHDAYMELYVPYEAHINTLTALLTNQIKANIFYTKSRHYGSALETALSGPNIPVAVYENLITTINNNLQPLHRWAKIKKQILKVEELHPYDTYAPLFPEVEKSYTYEEAQTIVKEALKPLGQEIQTFLDRAFSERWIDVYENQGKSGGAYMSSIYGVHPYILMNFNGTLSSVFTLAHELGHAIHSYYSDTNQPYIYSDYATFNAEVASTTNEALLRDYLLQHATSKGEKLRLLQEYVQDIGSTFYRQARFAEFEKVLYEMVEREEPLTPDVVNQIFRDIYQTYWGPDMVVDHAETLSWSRIPHFYYNFYVYTYATSFAAAQLIAQNIMDEGESAIEAYKSFLSSGSSDYPIALLKKAGVDMTTPEPIAATAHKMDALLDEMEALIAQK
jgi:oligoendopeptidase F